MITIQDLFWLIPSASVLALIFAGIFFYRMKAQDEGNEVMKMIARHVRSGAMAYLRQQYKIVAIFFVLITVVFAFLAYCLHIQNPWVPFAFISGGFFSGLAGYIGMKTATYASGRVANACRHSLDAGLQIAFRSGAVLGLTVVGLAMLDIGAWYWVLNWFYGDMELSMRLVVITTTMLTFGMGASLQALFARVGGGIFTKAADVGADLVGKVEAGIPEDDPRNPATIADNVGDNVGDVAGMGADLYESYCGSILASAALGAAAYMAVPEMALKAVLTPMLIAALGTILSLLGVYAVRVKRGEWKGGFGGPDGGMHNHIFGSQAPTSYLLMENVFADNDKADQAYLWAAQARLDEASGNKDKAIQAWEEALRQTPLHPFFRTELQRLLMEKEGMQPVDWYVYAKDALSHYQGNGFAAFDILKDVQNKFLMDIPPADRIAWFRDLHEAIATTPTSWAVKFQPVLDSQSAFLANPQEKAAYLETVLSTHLKTGDGTNFGQALEWGVKNFVENGQADVFSNAFAKVAQQTGKTGTSGKAPDPKKLKEAYGKAIYATETARSIPAFQALSKAAASFSGANATNNTVKASIPQGWKLVPADGMVRCSTTSQWDSPWDHINLLRPCGGAQHTDKEANPNVIVELKNGVNLAGLVVTKRDGNENRMKKMEVSTSTDGATWFPLAATENMPKEWVITAPEGTKAKWIKVEAKNAQPEFMHLRHILVYEK